MKKIDFKTSPYFSGIFIFLGVFLALIGIAALFIDVMNACILLFVSFMILSTHYRVSIDLEKKIFQDYVWFLGFRNGEKGKFEKIDYLFIKKSRIKQSMSMRAATTTILKEVYDGYLRFSEEEKIHLITKDDKKNVMTKLLEISTLLNVRIVDYSRGDADEI